MARKPQSESVGRPVARKRAGLKSGSAQKAAPASPARTGRKPTPLKDLSPEYRKRIRAAAAKAGVPVAKFRRDKTLTAKARGHAPTPAGKTESQLRRERLDVRIAALAARQAYRSGKHGGREADDIAASYRALIRDKGQGAFGALERLIAQRRRGEGSINTMDELDFDWAEYDGESAELFYN